MKLASYILLSVIQISFVFGASPFASQICDATQNGNCQEFSQSGGMKCVCNSYKPGSPVTFCSEYGSAGEFQLCAEGGEVKQKCALFCGNNGVLVCENGYCHSN